MHRRPRLHAWPREIHQSYIDQKQEGEGTWNCKLKYGGEKTGSQAVDMSLHVHFYFFCLNHQNFFSFTLYLSSMRTFSICWSVVASREAISRPLAWITSEPAAVWHWTKLQVCHLHTHKHTHTDTRTHWATALVAAFRVAPDDIGANTNSGQVILIMLW